MISLRLKIETKSARVVVIGVGYVGLPLVAEFARAGFRTTGLDKDPEKVRLLNAGDPDMRFIVAAAEEIARYQHDGMLVIPESTTYPGTTTEVLVPKLTENGAVV